ncbi:hypothetical protein HPB52_007410 [Rhipicephalus sanguineus]|uniref:Medium-chain acyl-CoA ligase ACSF2, mitochondrial n=1 Tax=Rhipicephalus sanguineus TaxID=34632 RepID=A0A9D4PL68_RHISA|nr:hypothetical protein HPB52_007410 [Rhipicephalus sanguineus]
MGTRAPRPMPHRVFCSADRINPAATERAGSCHGAIEGVRGGSKNSLGEAAWLSSKGRHTEMAQACKQAKTLRAAFEARQLLCRLIHKRAADYKNAFAGGQRRSLAGVSYHHNPGKQPLLPLTIGDVVDRAADQHGDNVAIVSCHQSIRKTYSEYKTDTGCEAVIFSAQFARQDYYKMLLQIAPELESSTPGDLKSSKLPDLKHVICISDERKAGTVTYADLMESVTNQHLKDMHAVASGLQFDDPINLQFTSGTTGKPKAAQLSHFNVVNNGYLTGEVLELDNQIICLNVPLIHCFGCVGGTMAATHFGATIALPAPGFKAEAALNCIQNEKCTHIYGTPTMHIDILHHLQNGQYDVSSVKRAVMAGSPCPPEVIKRVMTELNAQRFFILYGTTETSPVITATTPDDPLDKWIHSVGKAVQHTEVKIVDKENKIVPTGQRGELCARGYLVFMGYFDDEENTRKAVRNGWYHTGDEAVMAEDGRISIMGRIKDMIIRGGENLYPQEIEDFLYTHPAIQEVQVVGVPDKRMGEEACAWIILKPGCSATEEDIKSFCKGKLSHFKIPRYIFFVDTFPKTLSGKVQKFAIREKTCQMLNL